MCLPCGAHVVLVRKCYHQESRVNGMPAIASKEENKWAVSDNRYTILLAIGWTVVVGASLAWNVHVQRETAEEVAWSQARASFDRDLLFRQWNVMHGGLYAPVSETTCPDPYLDLGDRDVVLPSGQRLTLLSPAYMARQVHELGAKTTGVLGHIASLDPQRPESAADPWETGVLNHFQRDPAEYSEIVDVNGEPHFRLMRPLIAQEACLKCHGQRGHKEGDVLGGVSVSVPMAPVWAIGRTGAFSAVGWHAAFWVVGLAGIGFFHRFITRRSRQLAENDARRRESEERFMETFQSSNDAILLLDGDTFVDCNEATVRMLGCASRDEFLMKHPWELSPAVQPDGRVSAEKAEGLLCEAFKNGSHRFEWVHRRMGGEEFPTEVTLTVITYHGKSILHCHWRDLTEQKRAEEEAKRSYETLRRILQSLPVGVAIIAGDKTLRYVNPAALAMMKFDSAQEILGLKCHEVLCPPERGSCPVCDLGKKVENAERVLVTKDKRQIPVLKTVIPVNIDGEDVLLETFVDITDRKQAELALARSETKFRTLYDSTSDAVMLLDEHNFFDCNEATVRMFGCRNKEEVCAYHPADLSPARQPCGTDSLTVAKRQMAIAIETGSSRFEWTHFRRDTGEYFTVDVLLNALELDGRTVLQGVVRDITARKQAELALQTAKEEAETANRAKSEFLARMSHELRTPLTGILGFTDLLLGSSPDRQRQDEYLQVIRSSGKLLLELINDILDLSRIEAGQLGVERASCSPHGILSDVVSIMRAQALAKGVDLRCRWTGLVPSVVETDGARLRQILLNLVGNAVKFTQQGFVEVVARLDSSENRSTLLIDITDTGIGIPQDKLHSIFEPFVQADCSVTRQFGGTGLGLAISTHLARALGGDITVRSEPGVGSTFTVSLEAGDLTDVEMLAEPPVECVKAGQPAPQSSGLGMLGPAAVLLVEDGEINRKLIATVLHAAGLSVSVAENGQVGIDMATRDHYDLILMDMQMPVLDGYVATRKLRALGFEIPIIALTAHAMTGDEQKCREAGCSHYVSKPIDIDALLATVSAALEARRGSGTRPTTPTTTATTDDGSPLLRSSLPIEEPVFREIAQEFVEYLGRVLAEMREAVAEKDTVRMGDLAHALKGSAGTAGFDAFTEPARQLEMLARHRRLELIDETIDELTRLAERIEIPTETSDAAT